MRKVPHRIKKEKANFVQGKEYVQRKVFLFSESAGENQQCNAIFGWEYVYPYYMYKEEKNMYIKDPTKMFLGLTP